MIARTRRPDKTIWWSDCGGNVFVKKKPVNQRLDFSQISAEIHESRK